MHDLRRRWCDEAKLRCLIRGAKLADSDSCTTVKDKLHDMEKDKSQVTFDQMAGEYSRAAEMYDYVSAAFTAVIAS